MRNALFAAVSAVVLAAALPASAQAVHYGSWGVDLTGGDHTVQPGDNFWSYADGHWAQVTEIPADQGSAGVGADVFNRTQDELRQVIEDASKHPDLPTAVQIGGLYNAFMDEQRVEALDAKPLAPGLAAIAAVKDKAEFTALMGRSSFGLGKSVVGLDILPDPAKPEINTFIVFQAGLGLPDRDYYLTATFQAAARRLSRLHRAHVHADRLPGSGGSRQRGDRVRDAHRQGQLGRCRPSRHRQDQQPDDHRRTSGLRPGHRLERLFHQRASHRHSATASSSTRRPPSGTSPRSTPRRRSRR